MSSGGFIRSSGRWGAFFMFRNAGIIIHPEREDAQQFAQKASAILSGKNIKVHEMPGTESSEAPDIILTFGGDGTLLAGAHYR